MVAEYVPYQGPIVTRAEARTSGLKRFFTGAACRAGHLSQRLTSNKVCLACMRERSRARYAADPLASRAYQREYEAKHGDRAKRLNRERKRRQWLANPDKFRARIRAWAKANPEKKLTVNRRRRAREWSAEGSHTAQDIAAIRKAQSNRCAYCRARLGAGGHLDHIVPLVKGGSNWPRNLQWLCAPCNSAKQASDPIDYARRTGKLL